MKTRLALIRLIPVEPEGAADAAAKPLKNVKALVQRQRPVNPEQLLTEHAKFDIVALLEAERFDDGGRQANRQAVSPFCDLHDARSCFQHRYTLYTNVYQSLYARRARNQAAENRGR